MSRRTAPLARVLRLAAALEKEGMRPVLVGGMALVVLGSRRVTRDFDFLVSMDPRSAGRLVAVLYEQGFELVTKFDRRGDVVRSIDSPKVATLKIRAENPRSLFFFDWTDRLRVDLLLDFPLAAREVASRAAKLQLTAGSVRVASVEDLLRMKEIAFAERGSAGAAQDLEFLKRLVRKDS